MPGRSVEDSIQAEMVRVARERGLFIFHVPNGGNRSAREGAAFKRIGVMAGIPDLCVIGAEGKSYWIEVKTLKGTVSGAQKEVTEKMSALGQTVFIARGLRQGLEIVDTLCEREGIEL